MEGRNVVKKKKKTKKGDMNVDGNTFTQDFENLKFIQDYSKWKDNCQSVSGTDIGVLNIPTLWDFLVQHLIAEVIREESVNAGLDKVGLYPAITAIEKILDEEELTIKDIADIKILASELNEIKDSSLDPSRIVFTEKIYDEDSGEEIETKDLLGHYRTDTYVKRRKAAGKDDGIPAVDAGWYSGSGNPPYFAIFGGDDRYAKPKGLYEIMKDVSGVVGKQGEKIFINDLEVVNLKGRNQSETLAGLSAIERYFDKAITNEAFWNAGGKLLVKKLRDDFAAQSFKITPREQTAIRRISGLGFGDKAIAGTVREAKFTSTATPIIDLVNAALIRADKKTSPSEHPDGGYYRAWQNARRGGFDYRRTRREVFGDDVKGNPDGKVISKRWQEYLWR